MTNKIILDKECFDVGVSVLGGVSDKKEIKKYEDIIQKSLGVLQEDGVFAYYIYLKSLKGEEAKKIRKKSIVILGRVDIKVEDKPESITKLANRIEDLTLAKTMIEKTLIYARYHAKALEK